MDKGQITYNITYIYYLALILQYAMDNLGIEVY